MKRILVVEDDEQIRSMLCQALEDEGYSVACVQNGLEAVECVAEVQPDLIISDVMMPILDGGHLVSIMQAKFGDSAAPVLGVTALPELKRASDTLFTDVLYKPFDLNILLEKVEDLVNSEPQSSSSCY